MIKKSYCTTSYNTGKRLDDFLLSIVPNLKEDEELICIDNFSNEETDKNYQKYIENYPDKNIKIYSYKCNRGKGRDIASNYCRGEYIIQLDSDTIYLPVLFKVIDEWIKLDISKTNILFCSYCWVFPSNVYFKIGGYPNTNSSEDIYMYNLATRRGILRYCDIKVGENMFAVKHLESRFTNNFFHMIWRMILNYKDNIRIDDCKDYMDRIRDAKEFTNGKITFYLFWIPFLSVLSIYGINIQKTQRINILDYKMDFGIKAERNALTIQ